MTLSGFIKTAIARNDNLFITMYRFNEMISEYVEKSHILSIPFLGAHWEDFVCVERIGARLSRLLLRHFRLENESFYEFEDPRLRVALLSGEVLSRLLIYAGAAIYSERMSKLIMKKDVIALKESIGEDVYFFASKKASLFIGLAPRMDLPEGGVITKEVLFELGKRCLEMCLANEDERLLKRLVLKFPSELKWDFRVAVEEPQKTKAWNYLYRILIKEVKPDIQVCFT